MAFCPGALRLTSALQALHDGGVVACPTEAVWGLSCDPQNPRAVMRLLQLKQRPIAKGLILVAADSRQLEFLLHDLPQQQREQLAATWPGPATWLVPHHDRVAPWIRGAHRAVAVRVSAHPVVSALCQAWGGPLVSTSANPAGAQPAQACFQVHRYFGEAVDSLLPGAIGGADKPTEIRDLASGRVIRA